MCTYFINQVKLRLVVLFADKTNDSGYVTIQREDQELKDAAGIYFQQQQQQQQPQVTNLVEKKLSLL
jgi:hypothetical protein